jgi:hypothetical protein
MQIFCRFGETSQREPGTVLADGKVLPKEAWDSPQEDLGQAPGRPRTGPRKT